MSPRETSNRQLSWANVLVLRKNSSTACCLNATENLCPPEGPGLGVEIDEELLSRHIAPGMSPTVIDVKKGTRRE